MSLMDKYKMRHQPPLFQPKKLHPHGRRMTRGNTKLLLGLLWMPEILLNDYPPDIPEEAWPDERAVETSSGLSRHRDRGRGARIVTASFSAVRANGRDEIPEDSGPSTSDTR